MGLGFRVEGLGLKAWVVGENPTSVGCPEDRRPECSAARLPLEYAAFQQLDAVFWAVLTVRVAFCGRYIG